MVMPRSRSRSMVSRAWACMSRWEMVFGEFQQAVGERGFAVIDVGDDAEIANMILFDGVTHGDSYLPLATV